MERKWQFSGWISLATPIVMAIKTIIYEANGLYRDWVIHAFNKNLPYDKFLTWQLAGDLLPNPTKEQILATAFNRNHKYTEEGGVIQEEYRL